VGISRRVAGLRDFCGARRSPWPAWSARHGTASTPAFQMPVTSPGVTRSYRTGLPAGEVIPRRLPAGPVRLARTPAARVAAGSSLSAAIRKSAGERQVS